MDIYLDENMPLDLVPALQSAGFFVHSSQSLGHENRRFLDVEVLAAALERGLVVLTQDCSDYRNLHADGVPHCGVIDFQPSVGLNRIVEGALEVSSDPRSTGRFYASVEKSGIKFLNVLPSNQGHVRVWK